MRITRERLEELEIWKSVFGWSGLYEVSSYGRVRSLRFINNRVNKILAEPRIRRMNITSGYYRICLSNLENRIHVLVHRLVLESFVGPCPEGFEAAHLNGNRLDNRVSNLQWKTRKDNHADKLTHGTAQRGEKNGTAKLKDKTVLSIRSDFENGISQSELVKKYNLGWSNLNSIVRRRSWKHI